jgi:hypothetical protein
MARLARADLFDPSEVSILHCINRCVRRCFLCGDDPLTGKNYEHRKACLEKRLEFLTRPVRHRCAGVHLSLPDWTGRQLVRGQPTALISKRFV